ncbi:Tkp1 protein [Vanderwaltozyma polyspora DSM 70294]|uniref:Tkp1 protein n=1 Tax=Vanderwaltozyma polyspora (strain ATCC 22028 / DSM 70294 / BCRC 21397 / CBS 2163 / NBRC 10782 / NRRL Y-8283 / UCD 57-17) TaxID=436907 RepID=A7TGC2_VANPO|nr:Tkp1 protein [Vanderwaltozyma polyspora DSM 70294]EDO18692.1 Tkp1 protein [Vanderwaltozyma polyspora DSM 70294]
MHFSQLPSNIGAKDMQDSPIPVSSTGVRDFHFNNGSTVRISAASSPKVRYDLLSLDELDIAGIYADFSTCSLCDRNNHILTDIIKRGRFYWISTKYLILPIRSK